MHGHIQELNAPRTAPNDTRYVRLFNRYRKELLSKKVDHVIAVQTAQHVAAKYTKLAHEPITAWPYLPLAWGITARDKQDRRAALRRRAIKNGAPRYV